MSSCFTSLSLYAYFLAGSSRCFTSLSCKRTFQRPRLVALLASVVSLLSSYLVLILYEPELKAYFSVPLPVVLLA